MDKFRNLKFIGYCMAKIPPEELQIDYSFKDFINYCQFQLCLVSNRLMKDPIWDLYSEEDILSEYYAHAIAKDEDFANKVIQSIKGGNSDVYEWLDKMIDENKKEMEEQAKDLEDEINFSPESLGE